MRDCPDRDTCAARDVLHGGTSILLFCVRNGHECSYFNENVLIDSHIIRLSFSKRQAFFYIFVNKVAILIYIFVHYTQSSIISILAHLCVTPPRLMLAGKL